MCPWGRLCHLQHVPAGGWRWLGAGGDEMGTEQPRGGWQRRGWVPHGIRWGGDRNQPGFGTGDPKGHPGQGWVVLAMWWWMGCGAAYSSPLLGSPCVAVPLRAAGPAGAGGLPPPSFPWAPSRRSFPDDLTGCTFLNCLLDCFIIGGQLKRRRVPVAPLLTPSLPEPQNKRRNWAWARAACIPIRLLPVRAGLFWSRPSQGTSSPAQQRVSEKKIKKKSTLLSLQTYLLTGRLGN